MIHDIIKLNDGTEVQAVEEDRRACGGCYFQKHKGCHLVLCCEDEREDKVSAIYKQRINIKQLQSDTTVSP